MPTRGCGGTRDTAFAELDGAWRRPWRRRGRAFSQGQRQWVGSSPIRLPMRLPKGVACRTGRGPHSRAAGRHARRQGSLVPMPQLARKALCVSLRELAAGLAGQRYEHCQMKRAWSNRRAWRSSGRIMK